MTECIEDAIKIILRNWPPENYSMLREALELVICHANKATALERELNRLRQPTSLAATEERVREHEAHEKQTHEILGKILGTDDALENVAKRAVSRIAELEAQVAALKKIAEGERAVMLACAEDLHGIDEGHLIEARRQLSEEHPEAFR